MSETKYFTIKRNDLMYERDTLNDFLLQKITEYKNSNDNHELSNIIVKMKYELKMINRILNRNPKLNEIYISIGSKTTSITAIKGFSMDDNEKFINKYKIK